MKRSFSSELEEDLVFEIGGEEFEFYYPHHTITDRLYQEDLDFVVEQQAENGSPAFTFKADTKKAIEYVQFFLRDAEQKKRWVTLVQRKEDPVPRFQIIQLYRWLVEVTSGRPTKQLSALEPGAGETDISSTDESFSTEETSTT